ncbi:MAG TPA: AAA family ATPase [Gaiellales bacterium]|nr:AAA family ATPase [Gaiellales bacterium]
MICPRCATENSPGRKFCGECGAGLSQTCPACGTAVEPGTKFCGECGAALQPGGPAAAAVPPTPASAPAVAERRLVSVLFADLVGFTTLSEGRDSEEVRELLSRYFDTSRRLIELYGGTVEKFIGDAVMAVWGTPTATEDDAERAVRAALDLVAAVTALGDEVGIPDLRARAGVLTGEATVTVGAEGEGMVAGDLVNTASRIQAIAEPGQVLVGEPTRRATEPTIAYEEAGTHELKGKSGLHQLSRAVRVVSGVRGSLKSEGLEAPFVGRDRELRQIKDLFHASADEGRPHLVSVTGIAGIGKSRLVWEFYKYFDGLAQVIYWHRGRCLSYGEGVTYWALADMVRMRCRISEDDPSDTALEKLQAVLDEHLADPDERRFVEPRVAHLIGLEEGTAFAREDLFAAWRVFFERLADVFPAILVFEDMQWADASLLDFIEYLLDWSRQSPLFVVTAARPELLERRTTWGAGKRNFTSLYLEPLSEASMQALLEGLVPGLPDSLRDQILARAEGVPLYAMETVRMLLDRNHLMREGSVYRMAGPVEALEVPETLHALIAARLDGLSDEERRIVQDGAVLGKTFTRAAVEALSGIDGDRIESVLGALVRKEVLSIQADPRSPEHGQYGFLQDLMRRVAYEMLSLRDRRDRHLAAADYLERTLADDDEIVEVLASHYIEAYTVAPDADGAEAVRRRAHELLVRAGERAESLGAPTEAQRYYARAGELTDSPLDEAALLDLAAQMAMRAAAQDAALELATRAHELYQEAGEHGQAARTLIIQSRVDQMQGRLDQALERMNHAYEVLREEPPDEGFAMLTTRLAGAEYFSGNIERCAALVEGALDIAEALGMPTVLTNAIMIKAMVGASGRHPEEARGLFLLSLDLAQKYELREEASRACSNLSDLAFRRDRYEEALGHLDQAASLARLVGSRPHEWFALSESTYALYMLGRWDEAIAAYREIPEEVLPTGGTLLSPVSSILEIHIHRGNLAEARRLLGIYARLEDSPDVQERSGYAAAKACLLHAEGRSAEAVPVGETTIALGETLGIDGQDAKMGFLWAIEAALAVDDREKAGQLIDQVESIPPGLRPPSLSAHACRLRARLAEPDEAAALFRAADAGFRAIGLRFWLAVTLLEHAERLIADDNAGAAERLLAEARDAFADLQATPWLERADAAAARASVEAVS